MPRSAATGNMTITQLENLLNSRRKRLAELVRDRNKVQSRLDAIERQISSLQGRGLGGGATAVRARNAMSLVATMEKLLRNAGKPVAVGDIVAGVLKTGYRTTSPNFRGIVNQTLIKEKQFQNAGRGLYQVKK